MKKTKNNSGKRVVSVGLIGDMPVYDIEVRHHHAYVLAGSGVVSSNSNGADAFMCFAQSKLNVVDHQGHDWDERINV